MSALQKLLALFKTASPTDPLALARSKRAREAALKAAGVSCSQAKKQVAREFARRQA